MIIPKEIREKIEQKLKLDEDIEKFFRENEDVDGLYFPSMEIVDEPTGEEQSNGEFCSQSCGYCEDDFYGHYYWPMDNGKYLRMYFEC